MSFEWQTEEEKWDDGPIPTSAGKPRRPRRWFLLLGTAGLFIILGILLVRRQLNERVSDVSANIINDVQTSVDVLHRAVQQDDFELFVNLLSGRDLPWADAQQAWFRTGAYLDRASLGLTWLPEQTEVITITLSPDLLQANVLVQEQYAIDVGNQQTQTIGLQHQEMYRQGRTSWLLSPPDSPPPTGSETYQGLRLTLHYPAADAPIAARLGPDLDKKLVALCGLTPDLACPIAMQVTLTADTEQSVNLAQPGWLTQSGVGLELPAPSLVGLPVDEAAYQALFRGYASAIVTVAVNRAAGYQCCSHSIYYLALRDYLLHRLALASWPLTAADYGRILDNPFEPLDAGILWPGSLLDLSEAPDAWQAYAVVEFILSESPDASVGGLLRGLSQDDSFTFWLYSFLPTGPTTTHHWFQFVQEKTGIAATPPIPWPDQAVYRLCAPQVNNFNLDLYALDPAVNRFVQVQPLGLTWLSLFPLANDDGLFILESGRSSLMALWRPGQPLQPVTLPESLPPSPILFYAGQAGRQPLLSIFNRELVFLNLGRVDPAACTAETCSLSLLPGEQYTVWSPDGEHSLISNIPWARRQYTPMYQLTLADGNQQPLADAGSGIFPFWLDEETFGYARLDESQDVPQPALYLGTVTQPETALWIEPDRWLSLLPATNHSWMVAGLWTDNTTQERYLLLDLQQAGVAQHALLLVDRHNDTITQLSGLNKAVTEAKFSPGEGDGWLALVQLDSDAGKSLLTLYNLQQPQTMHRFSSPDNDLLNSFDWSADGQWLVRGEKDFTALFAPAYDYQQIFVSETDLCIFAAWGNQ